MRANERVLNLSIWDQEEFAGVSGREQVLRAQITVSFNYNVLLLW